MKTFNVIWLEKKSVNVKAKDRQEAERIVLDCEHEESDVSAELDCSPEAYEVV